MILHVDMDAFFASVEVLDDPSLAGRPLVVGGDGERGVVASCSYEARRHGIRSAMPSVRARRLCPAATFRAGRYDRYAEVSERIHEVFHRFTPLVEGIALDEAFLDVAGAQRLLGPVEHMAWAVRRAIADEVGLVCSVGVAASKFVAKLASEAAKPVADLDGVRPGPGVVVVEAGAELAFLHPLPVEALWGVGPATATRLRSLGIAAVGDLAAMPLEVVVGAVGRSAGRHLHDLSWARDPRRVEPERAVKSVGHEETYRHDRYDRDGLHAEIVRMADAVAGRLRKAGTKGRTVSLKVRFADFRTITRARTLDAAVDTSGVVARVATGLLDDVELEPGVRLLGVTVSSLAEPGERREQLTLDLGAVGSGSAGGHGHEQGADERREAAADAVEAVRARFGAGVVGPAVLLGDEGLRVGRRNDNRWGAVDASPSSGADR